MRADLARRGEGRRVECPRAVDVRGRIEVFSLRSIFGMGGEASATTGLAVDLTSRCKPFVTGKCPEHEAARLFR